MTKFSPVSTIRNSVIKIRKINIYESPILSVTRKNKTVHIVLDTGATASLISLAKANELKLKILPTIHRAVQVDGVSDLKVLGEIHTEFQRGNLSLQFSALVVNELGADLLGGTNFHKENDIYSRMAKDTIVIQGTNCFQSTPVEILKLDENKTTAKLLTVRKTQILMPGDVIEMELPPSCPENGVFIVEPKFNQGAPFCLPQIVTAQENIIRIELKDNSSADPIKVVKNSKPVQIRETITDHTEPERFSNASVRYFDKFKDTIPSGNKKVKSFEEIIKEVKVDQAGTMKPSEMKKFKDSLKEFSDVLGNDLPGYNNYYGPVHASIQFASRARPTSHKTRMPGYGTHGQKLYNQKALSMVEKGVLIDPYELGIQPVIINDAWVVKKQGSAHLKWEDCKVDDVRMVTGFDPVNKYLSPIPSKANDPMMIYTNLASWKYLGELDFADMYWQIKFNLETRREKRQLEYLCIRTVGGVLAYARGPNGLLGMDAITDELTDKLLGDLVLEGKVVKLADNVYFGGETIQKLHDVFHEIMKRCQLSNLRIKPKKIHLNIANADILGLHWSRGKLSPSVHKLDPLASCERPKTVKGMRSFLGGVRFNEVCLPSKKLANATELLDELTPSTKSGKDVIEWNEKLVEAFEEVQEICKEPLNVYVPRKGDFLYLVGDAAPSQGPGIGTKLLIQRQGSEKLLPSFNHGQRMKNNMLDWSPCEVEAFQLSQAIKKFKPFMRFVGTKTTALIDSRASVLAVQRLEEGKPSTSRRLQDLLTNLSAENIRVLHISAKLPSSILEYVDFASRNPVSCTNTNCTICEESKNPDITFFGKASINSSGSPGTFVPKMSMSVWKKIQQSSQDLRKVAALLESGKGPHRKLRNMNDVRKYLRACTLNKEGVVVAKENDKEEPFLERKLERIVIPKEFAYSYTTILHRQFNHPLPAQMLKQFNRNYFMLNAMEVIKEVTERCEYPCKAMKKLPKETFEYQTETKPDEAATYFNADVLKESGQKIFVLRENLTSFTETRFVKDETKQTLREAILILTSKLRSEKNITIRVDAQSSLKSLKEDRIIKSEQIDIEVGTAKNKNKNSVAEKCIRELREEMVRLSPHGGKISEMTLAKATRNLNSRIRYSGYSARELWVKRDQDSGKGLQFEDEELSDLQHKMRVKSHESSAKYESRNAEKVKIPKVKIGDRVFVKSDASKNKIRDQYLLLNFVPNKNEAELQKIGKKKNIVQVQLQNILKIEPDFKVDEPEDYLEELHIGADESKDNLENNDIDLEIKNKKKKGGNYRKRDDRHRCNFCIKMDRKNANHHYTKCESLLQVRPGLKKLNKKVKSYETEESSDEDPPNAPQDEINLIIFDDDDLEDLSLQETSLSVADYQYNLMDESDIEINPIDPTSEDNGTADIEDHFDTETSPPRSLQSQHLEEPDQANSSALSTSSKEDDGVQEEVDVKQQHDDAIQVPVIQHDGCCTPQSSPSQPRTRLGGRSLPGRSIEERNLAVNIPHPGTSGSIAGRLVHTGDVIRYFTGKVHEDQHVWLQATIQKMYKTLQRLHPTYYNIVNERGEEISLELLPGNQGWQILKEGSWQFVDDGERRPA